MLLFRKIALLALSLLMLLSIRLQASDNFTLISEKSLTPGANSETLAKEGNFVYVAQRHNGCAIVDVSNPAAPVNLTTLNPDPASIDIWDLQVLNNKLYLINEGDAVDSNFGNWVGVYIYDVTTPAAPVLDGIIMWGGGAWHHLGAHARSAAVAEISGSTYIFIWSTISYEVEVFDVSNPAAAIYVSTVQRPALFVDPGDVVYQDGRLYTAWMSGGFTIHDVSNPASPALLAHQPYIGIPTINGGVRSVAPTPDGQNVISGEYTFGGDIRLWDIASLPTVNLIDSWRLQTGALVWSVTATDDFAFVSHLEDGVRVLDIRGRTSLTPIGSFDPDPAAPSVIWAGIADVIVENNRVFTSHQTRGLFIADFGDQVSITSAVYQARKKKLTVYATSSAQPDVDLVADAYGLMTWNGRKGRYELVLSNVSSDPGTVTVYSSLTGKATSAVTAR